jgi:hypothetical protein
MESMPLLDCAGRRRSPPTLPSFHQNRPPRNKGRRYPPGPPSVEEIRYTLASTLGSSASLIRRPARQSTTITPRDLSPSALSPRSAHDRDGLGDRVISGPAWTRPERRKQGRPPV